jgi:hypothetical protein
LLALNAIMRLQLEAENARLRTAVKTLEGALRCAARVLAPYGRAG